MRTKSDQVSNPFARSILQIKGFLNTRGRVTTKSYNKFKAVQDRSCLFKNVRTHDLDRLMWFDRAPLTERRQGQKQLAGLLAIELPAQEYEPVQEQDQAECRQRINQAQGELERLAGMLAHKGYHQAATYVASATHRLFSYVRFWLQTGVAAARTTSLLERLMRELGRRLKRIAFGWSQAGAAKMARILIKKICDPQQWAAY